MKKYKVELEMFLPDEIKVEEIALEKRKFARKSMNKLADCLKRHFSGLKNYDVKVKVEQVLDKELQKEVPLEKLNKKAVKPKE